MLAVTAREMWPGCGDESIKSLVLAELGWEEDFFRGAWVRRLRSGGRVEIHRDLSLSSTLTLAMEAEIEHPRCNACSKELDADGVCDCEGADE